jgi:hypothetical protein
MAHTSWGQSVLSALVRYAELVLVVRRRITD